MKCPTCGAQDQEGKFCSQCGAALAGACASCGAELPSGGRFCTRCGAPAAGGSRGPRAPSWPWLVGGTALVLVLLVFLFPRDIDRAGPPFMTDPGAAVPGAAAPGGAPAPGAIGGAPAPGEGLLSSDMRTNADRLFNRIMTAAEQGDEAEVARFMPMAVQAYGLVEDLDHDGLFHLAILHLAGGQPAQARATAEQILEDAPDHILALGVAAAAAQQTGDQEAARSFHRRLLDAYPAEAARPLPEYLDHQRMLPEYRRAASDALGTG